MPILPYNESMTLPAIDDETHADEVRCVADLCADLILASDHAPRYGQAEMLLSDYSVEAGGSATIFAGQFAKLGGTVGLFGSVGDDEFGAFLLGQLREAGVGIGGIQRQAGVKTALGVNLVRRGRDRAMLTYLGAINAFGPEELIPALRANCRHWHIASYFLLNRLRPHWPAWAAACRAEGLTISLDTNWDPDERWEGVRELLPHLDLFLPNAAEACAIARTDDADQAGRALASLGPMVVVKRGADGATAYSQGNQWHDPGRPVSTLVDTVGAGDTFDAGFLYAWLRGEDIPACLRLSGHCARAGLSMPGGMRGQLHSADGLTVLQEERENT